MAGKMTLHDALQRTILMAAMLCYPLISAVFVVIAYDCPYPCSPAPPYQACADQGTIAGKIKLTWCPVDGADSYRIYRREIDCITGQPWEWICVDEQPAIQENYSPEEYLDTISRCWYVVGRDTPDIEDIDYEYAVSAVNGYGESEKSNLVFLHGWDVWRG